MSKVKDFANMREDQEKSQVFVPGKGTVPIPLSTLEPEPPQSTTAFYKTGDLVDGKYLVKGFLGEGGMGAVYKVHHQFLGIDLALKTFRSAKIDQEAWLRFQREAQAIGKLEHENIVRIYDFGITKEQMPFYTMELLQGEPLSDRIAGEGPLSLKEALRIFTRVASALTHAHHSGIVHRDIKPANIYVSAPNGTNQGIVKLVDFGIAKLASSKNQELTSVGLIFGSPLYMSPEQAMGGTIDHRTDIYSLGCTIVECLTEKTPFEGSTIIETLSMHQQEKPPSLIDLDKGSEYPQRLEGMIRKMLAKSPDDRYQTMEEVQRELEAIPVVAPKSQSATMEINVAPRKVTKKLVQEKKKALPLIPIAGGLVLLLAAGGIIYYTLAPRKVHNYPVTAPISNEDLKQVDDITNDPTSLLPSKPFFGIKDGERISNFTMQQEVGKIWDMDTNRAYNALKTTKFPISHRLAFEFNTSSVHESYRHAIKNFGDDVYELRFGPEVDPKKSFVEGLRVLTKLRSVSFRDSRTKSDAAITVSRLPNLENLDLGRCERMSGEDVANFPAIMQVKRLCIDEMKDIDPVLAKIRFSSVLNSLKVDNIPLTAKQIKTISSIPGLRVLEANNCEFTDSGLKYLATCRNLERLYVGQIDLTPSKVATLKSMKGLKFLSISPFTNQRATLAQLRKEMTEQGCKISSNTEPKPDYSGFMAPLSE
ncbi:MAG: protein kinase [Candidatus Obscuribacter sp.]|nr:protein kinase [Candidatus Obscuribacter sp.]MBL0185693.1 protein kinase [Candidatus Obscuribacter sp.]MBP6349890.1 protein kinase [Candidatus Obscuribacter sp.]MBP7575513.1 protein kinase [Candidatus Obscuribacter sp.]